jgi:hypothetical protein
MKKALIIGKIPPPIGGVRIHVQRLIDELGKRRYRNYHFYNLEQRTVWKLMAEIRKYAVIHLHTSNTVLQLLIAIYCQITSKPLIITYHSNWGRFSFFRNLIETLSAQLATVPIVQNYESLAKALKYNPDALKMSTYVPPVHVKPLPTIVYEDICTLKRDYAHIFCSNAWNLTFDKSGQEIYGILPLIKKFEAYKHSALVISDPSGNYQHSFRSKRYPCPPNVYWISEPHDFWPVLTLSDAFVRNTTTDATSLSIQEALTLNTQVFATDCVSRPASCIIYNHLDEIDLEEKIKTCTSTALWRDVTMDTVDRLVRLYDRWTGEWEQFERKT